MNHWDKRANDEVKMLMFVVSILLFIILQILAYVM
jgi:hypothetical protein